MNNMFIMMVVGMLLFGIFLIVMGASKSSSRRLPRWYTTNKFSVYIDRDDDRGWFGGNNDRGDFGGSSDDGGGDSD